MVRSTKVLSPKPAGTWDGAREDPGLLPSMCGLPRGGARLRVIIPSDKDAIDKNVDS